MKLTKVTVSLFHRLNHNLLIKQKQYVHKTKTQKKHAKNRETMSKRNNILWCVHEPSHTHASASANASAVVTANLA